MKSSVGDGAGSSGAGPMFDCRSGREDMCQGMATWSKTGRAEVEMRTRVRRSAKKRMVDVSRSRLREHNFSGTAKEIEVLYGEGGLTQGRVDEKM